MRLTQGTKHRPPSVGMEVLRLAAILGILLGLGSCAPTPSDFLVTGKISDAETGAGLAGVEISFSGSAPTAITARDGSWSQTGLRGDVAVTPTKSGWSFQPDSLIVSERNLDVDFTATKSAAPALASLAISPATATVEPYERTRFSASGEDQYGDEIAVSPTWSVVSGGGAFWPLTGASVEYTATYEGTIQIQAVQGTISAHATLQAVAATSPGPTPDPTPEPDPEPGPCVRIGAICNDGWRSDATGSGACSHHGGVAYWLCAKSGSEPLLPPVVPTSP